VLCFLRLSDATLNSPTPQFGTAEYVGSPGDDHCQFCHQPISGNYFRVNEAMACLGCAEKARGELAKDTHAAYMRGLLYGIGAAVVGMILYATFAITTGIIIGYVSLAVGWMVGNAILKGSGGVGGRRYQITAVLLTYLCRLDGSGSDLDPLRWQTEAGTGTRSGRETTTIGKRVRPARTHRHPGPQ
jgi:hypothetical protein